MLVGVIQALHPSACLKNQFSPATQQHMPDIELAYRWLLGQRREGRWWWWLTPGRYKNCCWPLSTPIRVSPCWGGGVVADGRPDDGCPLIWTPSLYGEGVGEGIGTGAQLENVNIPRGLKWTDVGRNWTDEGLNWTDEGLNWPGKRPNWTEEGLTWIIITCRRNRNLKPLFVHYFTLTLLVGVPISHTFIVIRSI